MEHYQQLIKVFPNQALHTPFDITISDLSAVFYCTDRNTKHILAKLQEKGWVRWRAGRGRGNYSQMTLLKELDDAIIEEVKLKVEHDSIEEAISFLQRYQTNQNIHQQFINWLFTAYQDNRETKDQLRFPSYRPVPILDPLFVNRRTENHMMYHVYSRLVYYDRVNQMYRGDVAHTWEVNHSSTEWIFYLRKGIIFHNGKEMTVGDVVYSLSRHGKTTSPYHWMTNFIHNVQVINTRTIKVVCNHSVPFLLQILSTLGASIVPSTISLNPRLPIGTGPFQITENTNDKLSLQAYTAYFDKRPFLDKVTVYFFSTLYDNRSSDAIKDQTQLNFFAYPYVKKDEAHYHQKTKIDEGSKLLTFNRKKGPLATDDLLRKAIVTALDQEKMIQELGGNRFVPGSRLIRNLEQKRLSHNLEAAKKLVLESNYAGEVLSLIGYTGAGNELDGTWIQERLHEIGVNVKTTFFPYQNLYDQLLESTDLLLGEQLAAEDELLTYLQAFLGNHSFMQLHLSIKDKHDIKKAIEKATSISILLDFLQTKEEYLCRENNHVHLYRLKQFSIYPPYAENVSMNALGWLDFSEIWYKN